MKKYGLIIGFTFLMGVLAGCAGTGSTTQDQAKTDAAHEVEAQDGADGVQTQDATGAGDAVTLPDLTEQRPVAYPPCVRVDGVDWRAACSTSLEAGARCRVTAVGATTLTVEPLSVPSHSAT